VIPVAGVRRRGEAVRQFILNNVGEHPGDIATFASEALGISRQAINKHLHHLVAQGTLEAAGTTRNRRYGLRALTHRVFDYSLEGLREDVVWRKDVAPLLSDLPDNVKAIWQYGLTEMLNNAIDHSSGGLVAISVIRDAITSHLVIEDNGEGIFKKIQKELRLDDERHAVLELAKGKLTTDPAHHSGEGIFFSSRMFDGFRIYSGNTVFSHLAEAVLDWIGEWPSFLSGTLVLMTLRNDTSRTTKEIFDSFTSDNDYGFTKTIVPVRLAQYGDEKLVSRSQAKRLLARFDRFKIVCLDFEEVESIGQAFADEVFRVFPLEHPNTLIVETDTNSEVQRMIDRARQHE
jgi:anti-sigma regulatory factor (Ser/Thr protein kinase)